MILTNHLRMITSDIVLMREPANIVLLSASLALVPAFIFWVDRQERLSRPALIPNSIWKNTAFTAVCLIVLLSFAVMQTMELFVSLFFQNVQQLSVLQSSIRFLPSVVVGFALELTTGFFVHRLSILHLILISSFLSAGAPLLMALINPNWPYWYDAFFAQVSHALRLPYRTYLDDDHCKGMLTKKPPSDPLLLQRRRPFHSRHPNRLRRLSNPHTIPRRRRLQHPSPIWNLHRSLCDGRHFQYYH